ncbi:exosortase C-terminal domain/associated protein EpsI [Variovorax sp. YR752]|uniref:exosortase C-terminal domain/associated protein EpsI n=1 Tax=Variovorax sp. YR752 TaxID=1884383 RepID=UPI003137F8F1
MNAGRRSATAIALAMGATAAAGLWVRQPPRPGTTPPRVALDHLLPDRFGDWSIDREAAVYVRAADARGRQVGFLDQVLERSFLDARGARVMLSVAYLGAQSSGMQLHRPEVCYRAAGFRVGDLAHASVDLGSGPLPITRLLAQMPGRPEPITYWMVVGGEAVLSQEQGWSDRLRRAWQRIGRDGVLVRISSIDGDVERAFRLHDRFAADMAATLAQAERELLLGSRSAAL